MYLLLALKSSQREAQGGTCRCMKFVNARSHAQTSVFLRYLDANYVNALSSHNTGERVGGCREVKIGLTHICFQELMDMH